MFPSIVPKKEAEKNTALEQSGPVAAVKISDVEPEKKGIKKYLAGISIGGGVILATIAAACLSKGTSGGLYKRMKKFTNQLNKKTYDLKSDYKNLTLQQKIKLKFAQALKPITVVLESSSNLNVLKDGFTLSVMKKLHLTKLANGINKVFKGIVMKTKNNSYKHAELSNVKFCNFLETLAKDPKAKELGRYSDDIGNAYSSTFSTQHHFKRAEDMWERLADLHENVWSSFNLFKKEKNIFAKENRGRLKSYITMDMCAKERNEVQEALKLRKNLISNGISDNFHALQSSMDNLKIYVDPTDKSAVELMQQLSEKVSRYNKLGGKSEAVERVELAKAMKENLESLRSHFRGISEVEVTNQIHKFHDILNPEMTKKGQVQEALTKIKEIFGKDSVEYAKATKYAEELNKNLNKAISTEMTAYEKLAELQMGSAPTDIFGILCPAALGVGLVINAKDKDQRIKNTLTQGIPIIGGVATAYYGTTRMLTGPTNMALGILSTVLLSIIGSKVDDVLKNYKQKQTVIKQEFETLKQSQHALRENIKTEALIKKEQQKNTQLAAKV